MRIPPRLVIFGLLANALVPTVASASGDDPKPAPPAVISADEPVYLFLTTPGDLDSFWKLIDRPDRVILDGALYRKLRRSAENAKPGEVRSSAVIESFQASGQIAGDSANLSLDLRVVLETDGPEWVPLRLDGLTLAEVREGAQDLPTKSAEDRSWSVELRGKGEHLVRVGLNAPVKSTVEGKRIELLIPMVASTGIDLVVPASVVEASIGLGEKLGIIREAGDSPARSRLQARLSPRSKLDIAWRERADPTAILPPLLEVKGDVAIDIERDSILTRSNWGVNSIRGAVGQIAIQLDNAEEVLDVLIDNRPVLVETRREGGRSFVAIPLVEPLRPGTSRALTLSTRRTIASAGTARVSIAGYEFAQAKVQSGMIAVSKSGPFYLNSPSSRGLRRIDPRTELPDSLRTHADTVLAYEFSGPPYELDLSIEPSPPRLQVEERTTVTIDPRLARVVTRLDCRVSQGRVFEVLVKLPKGLEFESAEPAEIVGTVQSVPLIPTGPSASVST